MGGSSERSAWNGGEGIGLLKGGTLTPAPQKVHQSGSKYMA
jgi:hypothetical protein